VWTDAAYLGLVVALGGLLIIVVFRWSEAVRRARRPSEPVHTGTPIEDPAAQARKRAVESIENQFSVTRRIALPALLLLIVTLSTLPFLNRFPAAIVSLLIGGRTVLFGLATRPFIENALSGLAISSSRLWSIGDTVILDGWYGKIEDITLTHTILKSWDWRRYVVPNSRMLQNPFVNASLFDPYQWAYVEFWVAYGSDLEKVRRLAVEAARSSPAFGGHEEPVFWVLEMARRGIRCWVAAWVDTPAEAWQLMHDTRAALFEGFRVEGIASHVQRHAPAPPFSGSGPG